MLFQQKNFVMHSGEPAHWKIDCDALTDDDIATVALMLSEILSPFSSVQGVPRGGLRLAEALLPYRSAAGPHLIVDDVLTTGASMEQVRADDSDIGAVIFARGPCPEWITALFQMPVSSGKGQPS